MPLASSWVLYWKWFWFLIFDFSWLLFLNTKHWSWKGIGTYECSQGWLFMIKWSMHLWVFHDYCSPRLWTFCYHTIIACNYNGELTSENWYFLSINHYNCVDNDENFLKEDILFKINPQNKKRCYKLWFYRRTRLNRQKKYGTELYKFQFCLVYQCAVELHFYCLRKKNTLAFWILLIYLVFILIFIYYKLMINCDTGSW